MLNEIIGGSDQHIRVVREVPKTNVAPGAEEASDSPCLVVMIYTEPQPSKVGLAANGAAVVLGFELLVIVGDGQAVAAEGVFKGL